LYNQQPVSRNELPPSFHILSYPVLLLSFNVLPTHFKPFIPPKNIPTFSHHHKPRPTPAVPLTLLPTFVQNMMVIQCNCHISHMLV
jgi:hypothetical protein